MFPQPKKRIQEKSPTTRLATMKTCGKPPLDNTDEDGTPLNEGSFKRTSAPPTWTCLELNWMIPRRKLVKRMKKIMITAWVEIMM